MATAVESTPVCCEAVPASSTAPAPIGYRDYVAAEGTLVEKTYRAMYENQTPDHVAAMKAHYVNGSHRYGDLHVWDALELMSQVIDESDPDTELPQIVHALQTAESIAARMQEVPEMADKDWLPLVGLIHDLGKVMLLKEYGSLPQWSVVGDIFPTGIPLHPACVYSDRGYQDANPGVNGTASLPAEKCGFEHLDFSWSHDEYLASVIERSNTNLPREAIYMIRHHSFYPWHTPAKWNVAAQGRPYADYASEFDDKMLPYLQMLQKADLYSKTRNLPERTTYEELVKKYIPHPLKF